MKHVPQLQLSDEEFDALNNAAAQANMGLYDYVLLTLVGRPPAGRRPPVEAPKFPPAMETKDAEVEQPADGGNPGKAGRRRG